MAREFWPCDGAARREVIHFVGLSMAHFDECVL